MGQARYFLSIEIAHSPDGLLSQHKYIMDILQETGLMNAKPTLFPMNKGLRLDDTTCDLLTTPDKYKKIVGKLLYLNMTRSNITFTVQQLSQHLQNPRSTHWQALTHLLKYLRGCPYMGLFFLASSSFQLQAYCDADWATCHTNRRSIFEFCNFLGSSLISWKSKGNKI